MGNVQSSVESLMIRLHAQDGNFVSLLTLLSHGEIFGKNICYIFFSHFVILSTAFYYNYELNVDKM